MAEHPQQRTPRSGQLTSARALRSMRSSAQHDQTVAFYRDLVGLPRSVAQPVAPARCRAGAP